MKLTLILFFLISTTIGQNIKGTILDTKYHKPLESVNVYFNNEKTGRASNN